MKKKIDIEKLLQWAFREELPKGHAVEASAWSLIETFGQLGARVDVSARGSSSGGLGFVPGEPHPDALAVAAAVRSMSREHRFSKTDCAGLLGDYAGVGELAIGAMAGVAFNLRALIIRCAALGAPMVWDIGVPRLCRVTRLDNQHAIVFGLDDAGQLIELRSDKKGRYPIGSAPRCHLEWTEPSIEQLLETRAEYAAWRHALASLALDLANRLGDIEATGPLRPADPWLTGDPPASIVLPGAAAGPMQKRPLAPTREKAVRPHESAIERKAREWRGKSQMRRKPTPRASRFNVI
jgi:hypothetical protein